MKTCSICGKTKPDEAFGWRHNRPSRYTYCKACDAAKARRRYRDDVEAGRKRVRKMYAKHAEKRKAAKVAYKERHPERVKAKDAVATAIRQGRISRQPCEICGSEPANAHHDDYSKPLDVRWLCALHHVRWHAEHGGSDD